MGTFNLDLLLDWVAANPDWALLAVFFIAFSESLAVVGLFMPGAVLMFGVGALIGSGALDFVPVFIAALLGAIGGDGVSFWLGRTFRQRLRVMWPFRTHPQLMTRGTDFFVRHGGKSILFGRFVGPIRPVIPAVAGMLRMPALQFLTVNILSALLWAPAYLLPGMVFGASLGLAAEVAGRLVVLLLLLITVVLLIVAATRLLFRALHPHTHRLMCRALEWTRLHPVMGEVPAALLDPAHPEAKGLSVLALTLLLATLAFVLLARAVGASELLTNLDTYIFHSLQALRTPVMDRLMVGFTELGDGFVLFTLFAVLFLWLLRKKRHMAAAHWAGAAGFALLLTQSLKLVTEVARPLALYDGPTSYSFPSGHAAHSTVVYGFLAVLIAREIPMTYRRPVYAMVASGVGAIAFSRLYLGAHWLSDVVGGLALGLIWVALLGIAYQRHPTAALPLKGLLVISLSAWALAAGIHMQRNFTIDVQRYAVTHEVRMIAATAWWSERWQEQPSYRLDLAGVHQHPLTIHYAGALDSIEQQLFNAGWRLPETVDSRNWLRWFSNAPLRELPLLPQVHKGRNESLLLIKEAEQGMLALRLWPSDVTLAAPAAALWLGNVSFIEIDRAIPGLRVPKTQPGFDEPLALLRADVKLSSLQAKAVVRSTADQHWDGRLLLLHSLHLPGLNHALQAFQPFKGIPQLEQVLLLSQLERQ